MITLTTPIQPAATQYVCVISVIWTVGTTALNTTAMLIYSPCNASGVPIGGPLAQSSIPLTPTDIAAYNAASGTVEEKAAAALISNQPQFAGTVT
jgi:hypothetical protein